MPESVPRGSHHAACRLGMCDLRSVVGKNPKIALEEGTWGCELRSCLFLEMLKRMSSRDGTLRNGRNQRLPRASPDGWGLPQCHDRRCGRIRILTSRRPAQDIFLEVVGRKEQILTNVRLVLQKHLPRILGGTWLVQGSSTEADILCGGSWQTGETAPGSHRTCRTTHRKSGNMVSPLGVHQVTTPGQESTTGSFS